MRRRFTTLTRAVAARIVTRKVITVNLREMSVQELNRALASARNKRDAFPAGREPREILHRIRVIQDEQNRRRADRS